MSSTQRAGFVDNLVTAIRDNPLAAALIGGGAFWLLAGNKNLKKAAGSASAAASSLADVAARNGQAAASRLQRTASPPTAPEIGRNESFDVSGHLRGAANAAAEVVSGAADQVRDRLGESATSAREKISALGDVLPDKQTYAKVQSGLADLLERQPLVLGVVGAAVGAALAGAFRTSDVENEWLGEISDDVKADLETRAGAVSQSIRESADTLKAELSDTGMEALDRVKQAGKDAATAVQDTVRAPDEGSRRSDG
jgi:hypothetical protein